MSDANVQSVDLLPTIADVLGIRLPWKSDGVPASKPRSNDQKDYFSSATVDFKRNALGKHHRADGDAGLRLMLARNERAFAPTPDPKWAVYRAGPSADLIGRRVDEVTTGPGAPLEVKVEDPGAFSSVDPASGTVPGLLRGYVADKSDATIAVVANGTIAGVSPTFVDSDGPARFAVLIPDFLFKAGKNEIQLYTVAGRGSEAVLHPLQVDGLG